MTLLVISVVKVASGQSTFGSVVGTVRDPSGGVVATCKVSIVNKDTSLRRASLTDGDGNYTFVNLEPGVYALTMESEGFQRSTFTNIELTARQALRIDGQLVMATQTETVMVSMALEPVIQTEASTVAE
jgi:hypothetical protein